MNSKEPTIEEYTKDVANILKQLNIPEEIKLELVNSIQKMNIEQIDELVKTLYQRLIEQKTAEELLSNDEGYKKQKDTLDKDSLDEINNILK